MNKLEQKGKVGKIAKITHNNNKLSQRVTESLLHLLFHRFIDS